MTGSTDTHYGQGPNAEEMERRREAMVAQQIARRGIRNPAVLEAMRAVPREAFVPEALRDYAYDDGPLPIGQEQTISQPFIVASMAEALELEPGDRVLEIGAGSGYVASVLSRIAAEVVAVERHKALADAAAERIEALGYDNVRIVHGDGTKGFAERAPYDAITVAAAGPSVPESLRQQLAVGGRLVIPVGATRYDQRLLRVRRVDEDRFEEKALDRVRFVPLIGAEGWDEEESSNPGSTGAADAETAPAKETSVEPATLLREHASPFEGLDVDVDAFVERIGDARVVLLGEATHGTSEFYEIRARLTRALIERSGFNLIAVEADWPDAARIDRWVRDIEEPPAEWRAFSRFPTWMWRNREVRDFVDWLREHNAPIRSLEDRVGFFGLDLYSLYTSVGAVLDYLDDIDPDAARVARQRYACLEPFEHDPAAYGRAALTGGYQDCEKEVVSNLSHLLENRLRYVGEDGHRYLDAAQNATLVRNAEQYYRSMYYGSRDSWNLRDSHMFETLRTLLSFRGPDAKAVVWEHNSHVGDARATEMSARGEHNVGQLCREEYGRDAYLVGFGTDRGTVAAASQWEGPMEIKTVRPARPDSYEAIGRESHLPRFALPLMDRDSDLVRALREPKLERAIGVLYRPETELESHYFEAVLPHQFDEWIYVEESRAVTPLEARDLGGVPETYPFGV